MLSWKSYVILEKVGDESRRQKSDLISEKVGDKQEVKKGLGQPREWVSMEGQETAREGKSKETRRTLGKEIFKGN